MAGLAVFAVLFATVVTYAEETLFDSETFANRTVSVLDDEAVQGELAGAITDAAIEGVPNAIAARPLIEGAAGLLVRSPALQSLLASGISDVHATVIAGDSDTLTVTLENVGVLIKQGLQAAAPNVADKISRQLDIDLAEGGDSDGEGIVIDASQIGHDLSVLNWVLLAVALLLAGGAVHFAPTRLAGVRRLGRSLAIGALLAVVVWQLGRTITVAQFDGDTRDVASAVYNAFLGDLRTWLLVLTGAGIVLTAGATSTREPIDARALAARTWDRLAAVPEGTVLRGARALLLLAAGILILQNRATFIDLMVLLIGAFVVYLGAAELMRLAAGAVRTEGATPSAAREAEEDLSGGALARIAVVGVLLVGGFVALGIGSNDEELPPLAGSTCNGSAELCDKRLAEVAFGEVHHDAE